MRVLSEKRLFVIQNFGILLLVGMEAESTMVQVALFAIW